MDDRLAVPEEAKQRAEGAAQRRISLVAFLMNAPAGPDANGEMALVSRLY